MLRGEDACRILEREFGVRYTLDGVYDLLHRLKLSCRCRARGTARTTRRPCNSGWRRPPLSKR